VLRAATVAGSAVAVASLLAAGCAETPVFAPRLPIRGEAGSGAGQVTADLRDITLPEKGAGVSIRLVLAASNGGSLVDARLGGATGAPCGGGVGPSEVTVDEQERYRVGPADVSGSGHELVLMFPLPPEGGWKQPQVALDLQLALGRLRAPACLRLTVSGTEGPDWK
jgi:hypothetical protein